MLTLCLMSTSLQWPLLVWFPNYTKLATRMIILENRNLISIYLTQDLFKIVQLSQVDLQTQLKSHFLGFTTQKSHF